MTAVPEPETYAMMLAGLGQLGFAAAAGFVIWGILTRHPHRGTLCYVSDSI